MIVVPAIESACRSHTRFLLSRVNNQALFTPASVHEQVFVPRNLTFDKADPRPQHCPHVGTARRASPRHRFCSVFTQIDRLSRLLLAFAGGVKNQFDAARNSQLVEDSVQVVTHGVFGDMKRAPDLTILHSLNHQANDFFLPSSQ